MRAVEKVKAAPRQAPAAAGEMSVLGRTAVILDLLTEDSPSLTVDRVGERLQVSAATAYRYLGELCEMGLLHRVSGTYAPGPKVLELDYLIRKFDPILRVSRGMMVELSERTGCHVLLSRLYAQSLVHVFYSKAEGLADIPFVPGRRLPVFRGSPSRIVMAFMDRRRLRRLYDSHADDPWRARIGASWEEFAATNSAVRRAGYYIARNELGANITGVSAPVLGEQGDPLGALVMTFASDSPPWIGEETIAKVTVQHAQQISKLIAAL